LDEEGLRQHGDFTHTVYRLSSEITMLMKTLLVQALLAGAAFAVPSSQSRMAKRLAQRDSRRSTPVQRDSVNTEFSSNWAGAVLVANSATYESVTATFTVPTASGSSGSAASAWVGIDGDTCGSAILQTGVDFTVSGSETTYDAWYEWFPDFAHDFSGISISAGHEIQLTVTAPSSPSGTAVIHNLSNGQSVSKSLTSTSALCQTNAEWIVEDFEEGSSLVPFADFGTITFSGASAGTTSGSVGPSGATAIDIEQNSEVLTSVSIGSSSVTVSYV